MYNIIQTSYKKNVDDINDSVVSRSENLKEK